MKVWIVEYTMDDDESYWWIDRVYINENDARNRVYELEGLDKDLYARVTNKEVYE